MNLSRKSPFIMISIWLAATLLWWGFAFYPTGNESPEWLEVARNVCFGTLSNGLPDTAGWMVLILGPLSFLVMGYIIWSDEINIALKEIWLAPTGKLIAVLLATAVAVETSWVIERVRYGLQVENIEFENQTTEDLPAHYPHTSKRVQDFSLTDQFGSEIKLSNFKDETLLLTFAFAHCQTVCPVLVEQVIEATEKSNNKNLRIFIVTLDPWRDTPKSLPFLAEKWGLPAKAHVLSGTVENVISVLKQFNVPYSRDEKTGEVTHPALTYLIQPGGTLAFSFNNAPTRWLHQAIERIEKNGQLPTAAR